MSSLLNKTKDKFKEKKDAIEAKATQKITNMAAEAAKGAVKEVVQETRDKIVKKKPSEEGEASSSEPAEPEKKGFVAKAEAAVVNKMKDAMKEGAKKGMKDGVKGAKTGFSLTYSGLKTGIKSSVEGVAEGVRNQSGNRKSIEKEGAEGASTEEVAEGTSAKGTGKEVVDTGKAPKKTSMFGSWTKKVSSFATETAISVAKNAAKQGIDSLEKRNSKDKDTMDKDASRATDGSSNASASNGTSSSATNDKEKKADSGAADATSEASGDGSSRRQSTSFFGAVGKKALGVAADATMAAAKDAISSKKKDNDAKGSSKGTGKGKTAKGDDDSDDDEPQKKSMWGAVAGAVGKQALGYAKTHAVSMAKTATVQSAKFVESQSKRIVSQKIKEMEGEFGEHGDHSKEDGMFREVALALEEFKVFQDVPKEQIVGSLFALYTLHRTKRLRNMASFRARSRERPQNLDIVLRLAQHSFAVYEDSDEAYEKIMGCDPSEITIEKSQVAREAFLRPYYIVVDHTLKAAVLVVRGTDSINGVMIDIGTRSSDFFEGKAHFGVQKAAQEVFTHGKEALYNAISKYNLKKVYVTGHSLGAGIAALITILMLRVQNSMPFDLIAHVFSPPPVISNTVDSRLFRDRLTSWILGDDVVPRLSITNVMNLKTDMEEVAKKGVVSHGISVISNTVAGFRRRKSTTDEDEEKTEEASDNLCIPGRVYHMFKRRNAKLPAFVLPSDPSSFREILVVLPEMVLDHRMMTYIRTIENIIDPEKANRDAEERKKKRRKARKGSTDSLGEAIDDEASVLGTNDEEGEDESMLFADEEGAFSAGNFVGKLSDIKLTDSSTENKEKKLPQKRNSVPTSSPPAEVVDFPAAEAFDEDPAIALASSRSEPVVPLPSAPSAPEMPKEL